MKTLIKATSLILFFFFLSGCGKSEEKKPSEQKQNGVFVNADGSLGGRDLQVMRVTPESDLFVDLRSIKHDGDIASVWLIMNYKGENLMRLKEKYNASSSKTLNQYNCLDKTSRQTTTVVYTEPMLSGTIALEKEASGDNAAWSKEQPDSVGTAILSIVCK